MGTHQSFAHRALPVSKAERRRSTARAHHELTAMRRYCNASVYPHNCNAYDVLYAAARTITGRLHHMFTCEGSDL